MNTDHKQLYQREKARRSALWKLQSLRPGDPAAAEFLDILDKIERDDNEHHPCGTEQLTLEQVRETVQVTHLSERFHVVRDEDIPEPWRERFGQASVGSTRLPEGFYAHDWSKFLRLWEREIQHFKAHRDACANS